MLVNIFGAKCIGIDAVPVTVEVDVVPGIGIHLVGLADVAVRESLLRTITALQSLDFRIPGRKIVINLAPADIHKSGSGFDVPIALGIIAASGQKVFPSLDKYLIMGELGLDGTVRSVSGALPIVELAIKQGFKGCILPLESALEALEFRQIPIYGVRNLPEVIRILSEEDDCGDLLIWNSGEVLDFDNHGGRVQSSDRMDFSEETIAIVALLHDVCKVNFYTTEMRNRKNEETGQWEKVPFYTINDTLPYGHGEKSVYIISGYLYGEGRLTRDEACAIRWHMGFSYGSIEERGTIGKALEMYPLAFALHVADMEASYFLEGSDK